MSERKLATIKRITDIRPIEGADNIELASVGGWNVVVAKTAGHNIGDLVVYCEIDSFLPISEEFEFLRKSSYKKMGDQEGFRLKTIRLLNQISQGLILSLDVLLRFGVSTDDVYEGLEVTEMLGIVKYEPPVPAELTGKIKGRFPSFLRRTDEERVQNLSSEYQEWKVSSNHKFYVTEKLDGSSATFYYKDEVFGVCSRNLELLETEDNTFWKVARELDLENKMREFGLNISIQGELIGSGVNGNIYKMNNHDVRFFNLFDIDNQEYHNLSMLESIANRFGIQTVPILVRNYTLPDTVDDLIQQADGKSVINENTDREGLVIRSIDRKISFKVISNKFLLKNEK